MRKTDYICTLDQKIQDAIKNELVALDFSMEDLNAAMCSRLCDLEDIINIEEFCTENF